MQQVTQNRSQMRLPDEQLQAGLQRATAPLFVFSKYQEPHAALNPTVQVVLRPRPASLPSSPTALLGVATATLQKAFPDFRFVEPIQDARVSGLRAAYMKATYTLPNRGRPRAPRLVAHVAGSARVVHVLGGNEWCPGGTGPL